MTVLALALVIGVFNGLRSFTPPAAAAWAAHLRWIKLKGPLTLIGTAVRRLREFRSFVDSKTTRNVYVR